jgi:hypothetical protein
LKWIKKGHIFKPSGNLDWSTSHAQIPRAIVLEDRIRIFYATRYFDAQQLPLSQTSFIDVDKNDLTQIMAVNENPSLELGKSGNFSEHGIHPTMLVQQKEEVTFFYQGWQRTSPYPYTTKIGIAKSSDNGKTFVRQGKEPILSTSEENPFFVNGVFVLQNEDENHLWYSSGTEWIEDQGRYESVYRIKHGSSQRLYQWQLDQGFCIEEKEEKECQNSATVIELNGIYHMWFCYRPGLNFRNSKRGYRIGYATSEDLVHWKRDDSQSGIDISSDTTSWDHEMVCYPFVFRVDNRVLMLYCGNYFGKAGFGYAELALN